MIGVLGFDSRQRLGIFLFTTASRTALGSMRPPIQWVPGALSLGVKRLGREADHSPPSSTKVKEWVELYLHSPNTPSWSGAQLSTWTTFSLPLLLHKRYCIVTFILSCSTYIQNNTIPTSWYYIHLTTNKFNPLTADLIPLHMKKPILSDYHHFHLLRKKCTMICHDCLI
jgi:hypothetical protein